MTRCSQHPEAGATAACTRCDRPLCDACTDRLDGRPYCADCVNELQRMLEDRARLGEEPSPAETAAPIEPQGAPPWGRAAAFGVLVGLVGAGVWYGSVVVSDYKLGLVAIGVGLLVGAACIKGAGGRASAGLGLLSLGIAVGAIALGEYLIVNHLVLKAVAEQNPGKELVAFIPLGAFVDLYAENLSPMDFVFYTIDAYKAYKVPAGRGQKR